jgi:hypothetical protein
MSSKQGGGSTTTVTKSDPWEGQQPYLKEQFGKAQELYSSGKLAPSYYPGSTVAEQSGDTLMAQNLTRQRALTGSPITNAANQNITATLRGDYLDPRTNPGYQQTLDDLKSNYATGTAAQTDAMAARGGAFGGSAHQEMMQRNNRAFADSLNKTAGDMYTAERSNQLRAGLLAPSIADADYNDINRLGAIGADNENYRQQQINSNIDRYNTNANKDALALQRYIELTQGNYGGTSSGTATGPTQYRNWGAGALGGALTGAKIGSAIPGIGTGLGAIGGGLLGLF